MLFVFSVLRLALQVQKHQWMLLFSCSVLSICDPMDCNTPGFPVLHHLLEFAQIHIH